mgnify:CR=1 FL=1
MGQYFCLANLDRLEWVDPSTVGSPDKWSQWDPRSRLIQAMALLLADDRPREDYKADDMRGRWSGQRVVIAGDYAERGHLTPDGSYKTLYEHVRSHPSWMDIGRQVDQALREDGGGI